MPPIWDPFDLATLLALYECRSSHTLSVFGMQTDGLSLQIQFSCRNRECGTFSTTMEVREVDLAETARKRVEDTCDAKVQEGLLRRKTAPILEQARSSLQRALEYMPRSLYETSDGRPSSSAAPPQRSRIPRNIVDYLEIEKIACPNGHRIASMQISDSLIANPRMAKKVQLFCLGSWECPYSNGDSSYNQARLKRQIVLYAPNEEVDGVRAAIDDLIARGTLVHPERKILRATSLDGSPPISSARPTPPPTPAAPPPAPPKEPEKKEEEDPTTKRFKLLEYD